jgi:hypothetical protein
MSDDADLTAAREELADAARIDLIRRKAVIEPGTPGECDRCGEESLHLVRNTCSPCRDKFKLP